MKTTLVKLLFTIMLSVLILSMLTGCGAKTPQTADGFIQVTEDAGFETIDVTSETETNDLATSVIIAVGENYQIEFYELIDSDTGRGVFDNNMDIFDKEHPTKTLSLKVNTNNYNYYAFNSDGEFHMIARIDNTMLYCVADKTYRNEIIELVKTLGYK